MVDIISIFCWLFMRRFAIDRYNLEALPNMRVRQSRGLDALNAVSRKDTGGQVGQSKFINKHRE